MSPHHVAVIDIGKTNAKVALVDLAGPFEVAVRHQPNRVLAGPPYPHFDIDRLWCFILESLGSLNTEQTIDGIAVTTHGAAAALLDRDGELALPVLDYECTAPEEVKAAYDAVRPEFTETGSPRLPAGLNLGAQLFWLQKRFPAEFARTTVILPYPQYWSYRLTGIASSEATSLGCHTDLWSPAGRDYSGLVDRMGWRAKMAPLRRAGDVLGPILPDLADAAAIAPHCPVVCGIHDSNASLLPHLMRERRPFSVVSTGTWVIAMAVGGAKADLDAGCDTLINVDAFGEPVPSARFMGGREHARILGDETVEYGMDDLISVLRGKTMVLAPVEGGTGPFPGGPGGWTVAPETLSAGERAAAAACYIALMTATCLAMIGAQGPVLVEGAFTRDPRLPSLIAALTGRPVHADSLQTTGTSTGAAMLLQPLRGQPRKKADQAGSLDVPPELIRSYASEWSRLSQGGREEFR